MLVDNQMAGLGNDIYYSEGFRAVIEDHMSYLRTHPETRVVELPNNEAYKYEYDFYMLLSRLSIPYHLHWVVLRLNGFTAPNQLRAGLQSILVPSEAEMERMRSNYSSTNKVK